MERGTGDGTAGEQGTADAAGASIPLDLRFEVDGREVRVEAAVPAGDMTVEDLLPLLRGLAGVVVAERTRTIQGEGKAISCRAGCGICCRQVVPVARAEAVRLARVVRSMPPERRAEIERRFERALERVRAADLGSHVEEHGGADEPEEERRRLVTGYPRLGVPCPFLEDESCGIYEERPLRCREYVVTTPASHCATLVEVDADGRPVPELPIDVVGIPAKASETLMGFDGDRREGMPQYLPLVRALEFARRHPDLVDDPPRFPSQELVRATLNQMFDPEGRTAGGTSPDERSTMG